MWKQRINRASAFLLACLMLFLTVYNPALAAEREIRISSAEELVDFAKKCSLDTWSQGKTVRLTADIDLTESDFSTIPTFGGTFLGDNHTITGLSLTANGSRQGLFRYIQSGGKVSDLRVEGTIKPGGSCTDIGGIAGSNSGTIENCDFKGVVKGDTNVGGIAGINHETGQINNCSVSGKVQGQTAAGGVAGKNLGILMKCTNRASVNTTQKTTVFGTDTEETLQQLAGTNTVESVLDGHTDTGGVVGYSSGVVQSCTNKGTVGYPHIGYNVGGIAGRQTGYLAGCTNSGKVLGRKDVGGIAGQAEPYVLMMPGGDELGRLRKELDTLDALISKALDDVDTASGDVSKRLDKMGKITDKAKDSSKVLADSSIDFINDNMDAISSINVTLVNGLDNLAPAVDELEKAAHWMDLMTGKLEEGLNKLEIAPKDKIALETAVQRLQGAYSAMLKASGDLKKALENLEKVLIQDDKDNKGDKNDKNEAIKEVSDALKELIDAYKKAGDAFGDMEKPLESIEVDGKLPVKLKKDFYQMAEATEQAEAALPENPENWEEIKKALTKVGEALDKELAAAQKLSGAAEALFKALTNIDDTNLKEAKKAFAAAAGHASSFSRSLEKAFGTMAEVVRKLSEDGPVTFATFGEETRAASEDLYTALGGLSSEMKKLNTSMNSSGNVLTEDVRAISHQFNTVFDVLIASIADLKDGSGKKNMEDYIEDTSDEDIAATKLGKVTNCQSTGAVEGDRNVGGILGTMAFEYDLDPEDDAEHFSFSNIYEFKVVLENCVNKGSVTGKKDCVGGLVGRMDIGTAIDGQNYGAVESTSGNYAGGAAGWSEGSIRRCYAKCTLSGGDYIGGLAGWTNKLTDSYAIATVLDGTEFVGAVAGDADLKDGMIYNNSYVDTGVAAIDGISYTGKAVPVAFEDLRKQKDIPEEFVSFTLTLIADGETVAKIPFLYGNDLSLIELPEVPEREGEYGKWPEFDTSGLKSDITLEAVYAPWITLIDSEEKDEKLSMALAEGSFTEEAKLKVTVNKDAPPMENASAVWDIKLTGTDLDNSAKVPLRLLSKSGKNAEVWQLTDGKWKQTEAVRSGQYLLLTMNGTSGTFCICEKADNTMAIAGIVLVLAALLLVGNGVRVRRKHKKQGKKKKTESAS